MDTNNATLFMKIAKVMGQVRQLEKSGQNTYDKYDYMRADDISRRIGSALAAAGIAFFPSIVSVDTSEYTTAKGAANFRSVVNMQMTFACAETGATFTSLWSGEAIDRSDKSISKAAVSATKYFLIKTFLLSGGDEDDADSESPQVETRKAPAKAAPATSYHDDELWEPTSNAPKKPDTLSQAQLTRLHILGQDLYGPEWDEQRVKLVQAASKGAVSSSKELSADEASVLIKGMEKKLKEVQALKAEATNGKVHA